MEATFITDEYSQDPESAIRFAHDASLSCVELRSMWGKRNICALSKQELSRLRALMRDANISACVIDTFVFKMPFGSPQDRDKNVALADRAVDIAKFLGAPAIRVFAFWADGAPDASTVAEEIRRIAAVARDRGVRALVENGTFSSVGQGTKLARLLRLVDDPMVSALWDPGNVINGGSPESVEDGLRSLTGMVGHVHVKSPHDGVPGNTVFGPIAGGRIDWRLQIRMLREACYTGLLSLETHWRKRRILRGREVFDFPNGYEFSDDGEESTAHMLGELSALLEPARTASNIHCLSLDTSV